VNGRHGLDRLALLGTVMYAGALPHPQGERGNVERNPNAVRERRQRRPEDVGYALER
jgi:hypothetical protein